MHSRHNGQNRRRPPVAIHHVAIGGHHAQRETNSDKQIHSCKSGSSIQAMPRPNPQQAKSVPSADHRTRHPRLPHPNRFPRPRRPPGRRTHQKQRIYLFPQPPTQPTYEAHPCPIRPIYLPHSSRLNSPYTVALYSGYLKASYQQ